jgi:hypothetical protein
MKRAARELMARRERSTAVTRINHRPAENQIWSNSLSRARWYSDNSPDHQIVQGWIVHPYIRYSDTEGQTAIEPFYWNYSTKENEHISYGPVMQDGRVFIQDRWVLLSPDGRMHYPFPPILHLIQMPEGLLWTYRDAEDNLFTMADIQDQDLSQAVLELDPNPESGAATTSLVSASGTSLGSSNRF